MMNRNTLGTSVPVNRTSGPSYSNSPVNLSTSVPNTSRFGTPGGLKIANYRLGKTLGIGSFGKVKLAEHELTGHQVAVKILNRKKIKSLRMDEKIGREIQILKLFRHPHIIKLYEVIETPTDIFMIMEYVSGGELFEYIVSNGRLSENEARRFFQQIISSVEYCHRHMVVHRDLKPENLLLDSNANVKIADFGLSNIMKDGDFLKTSCGSPNYAAPEVISGQLYAGPEVDVWSCGVILFALLCARLPFDDEYIPNLFKKIREGIYTIPDHISPEARELISSMLVVDPVKRITMSEIREHPWFRKNLPKYLEYQPAAIDTRRLDIHNLDQNAMKDLMSKLRVTKEQVLGEFMAFNETGKVNDLVVAYYLMVDANKTYETKNSEPVPTPAGLSKSLPPLMSPLFSVGSPASYRTPTFMNTPVTPDRTALGEGDNQGVHGLRRRASRWSLGLLSKQSPKQIMDEVIRVLRKINFEWKVVTPYQLRCRSMDDHNIDRHQVKIGVQLYKLKDGNCLLDLKRLDGDIFPFLEVSQELLAEFTHNSGVFSDPASNPTAS